jgi:formylglycine-generating enzyme required for sulfatase activity
MGSDTGSQSASPAHDVFVGPFEIEVTEVTVGQVERYVDETGRLPLVWADGPPPLNPDRPAAGILWKEAAAYCEWYGLRLPTEAEWEKAARGTDQRTYPWGDNWDPSLANTAESRANTAVEVGRYPGGASPYGVLDMSGNLQEWVADYFDPTYYQQGPSRDPRGPVQVLGDHERGGSWDSPAAQSTTFFRNSSHSVLPNDRVGFLCAADL